MSEAGGARLARIREFARTGRPAAGLIAGTLLGLVLLVLGVWNLKGDNAAAAGVPLCAIAGILASGSSRSFRLLVAADVALLCVMAVVAYTPTMTVLSSRLIRADSLPGDGVNAVVVLSANVTTGRTLSDVGTDRLLTGIALMRKGVAPRLLTTRVTYRGHGLTVNTDADQQALTELAGVRDRWTLVPDYVGNTHDEALEVDRRLRPLGATTIALVTSPWHTRRACATFEHVAFRVYCVPAAEHGSQTRNPLLARDRLASFRFYLYEQIGWLEYWRRGWVAAR